MLGMGEKMILPVLACILILGMIVLFQYAKDTTADVEVVHLK